MLCYAILVLLDGQHTFFTHTHTHTHTHRGGGRSQEGSPQENPKVDRVFSPSPFLIKKVRTLTKNLTFKGGIDNGAESESKTRGE